MARKRKQKKAKKSRTQAQQADKYTLYQKSVQEPEPDLLLINRIFKTHFGRPARLLREDFCGTALTSCSWVEMNRENRAWAIDLDPEPLNWGREHNVSALTDDQASRVKLIEGDVLDIGHEKVDVTIAFNFSYFLFKTRREMAEYLVRARGTLRPEGLLILDVYGGPDAQRTYEEPRELDGFDYIWDQHRFDPINNFGYNYIHFEFPDGSRMNRAFAYDWRLWSLPELREILHEVGFSHVETYWEGTEADTGEGNSIFTRRTKAVDDPAWVAYLVARN